MVNVISDIIADSGHLIHHFLKPFAIRIQMCKGIHGLISPVLLHPFWVQLQPFVQKIIFCIRGLVSRRFMSHNTNAFQWVNGCAQDQQGFRISGPTGRCQNALQVRFNRTATLFCGLQGP